MRKKCKILIATCNIYNSETKTVNENVHIKAGFTVSQQEVINRYANNGTPILEMKDAKIYTGTALMDDDIYFDAAYYQLKEEQ